MHLTPVRLLVLALASSLATAGMARADYMNWSYSTSAVPAGFSETTLQGSGSVQLTPFTNATAASSIPVLAYVTSASAPVTFNSAISTYVLTVTIKDGTTGDTNSVMFNGAVGGNLTATTSAVANTFSTVSQTMTLDGHTYTVAVPASVLLAAPTSNQQNIMATVTVDGSGSGSGSGGGIAGVPEPASCLLGSLGFAALGVGGWWERLRRSRRMA